MRLSVIRHKRIDVNQLRDPVPRAVGHAGCDHAAIAMADQHDVPQVFLSDDVEDVLNVRFEIDRRVGEMLALANAGLGRRDQAMPGGSHQRLHLFPCPSGRPRAMADEKGRSHDVPRCTATKVNLRYYRSSAWCKRPAQIQKRSLGRAESANLE